MPVRAQLAHSYTAVFAAPRAQELASGGDVNEAVRRLICYLNDLPSPEARQIVRKLKGYEKKR